MARSDRFERPTHGFEARCSIQLSYERTLEIAIRGATMLCQGEAGSFLASMFGSRYPTAHETTPIEPLP